MTSNFDTTIVAVFITIAGISIIILIYDYVFFKDVMLIAIPTGFALFTSKYVANSWQIRNAKINMKKEILKGFNESLKQSVVILDQFVFQVMQEYGDYEPATYDLNTGQSDITIIFPNVVNEQPKQKFSRQINELKNNIVEMRLKYNDAYSKLHLFFNNKRMNDQWNELDRHITYCRSIIFKLVESTTQDEFVEWYTTYFVAMNIIKNKMNLLSENIIDERLGEMTI